MSDDIKKVDEPVSKCPKCGAPPHAEKAWLGKSGVVRVCSKCGADFTPAEQPTEAGSEGLEVLGETSALERLILQYKRVYSGLAMEMGWDKDHCGKLADKVCDAARTEALQRAVAAKGAIPEEQDKGSKLEVMIKYLYFVSPDNDLFEVDQMVESVRTESATLHKLVGEMVGALEASYKVMTTCPGREANYGDWKEWTDAKHEAKTEAIAVLAKAKEIGEGRE